MGGNGGGVFVDRVADVGRKVQKEKILSKKDHSGATRKIFTPGGFHSKKKSDEKEGITLIAMAEEKEGRVENDDEKNKRNVNRKRTKKYGQGDSQSTLCC